MARPKRDTVPFSCKLDRELNETLDKVCTETSRSKTAVVELGLRMYFDLYEKQKTAKDWGSLV